jgi:CheY-like chemotaxis protein
MPTNEPRTILLVEDSPSDVRLTQEALKDASVQAKLAVVSDGEEALDYLRRTGPHAAAPRPDLILLDLNLPKRDGREVLAEIKSDVNLRKIPTVVLTTSTSQHDIARAYDLRANCYIAKPSDLDNFFAAIQDCAHFWLDVATLPG